MDSRIIVVGAGPVGLGLAIELGQRGVRTIVIERYPAPQPVPKGQHLTQRTMEHFHFWGVEEAVRAARPIPPEWGIGGLTAYGTLLGKYHYDWLQRGLVRPFYYTDHERLPQYGTEQALRDRVDQIGDAELLTGWQAESLSQDDAGVTVIAVNRTTGESRRFRADYLAGCDGSRSMVREAAGIPQTQWDHNRLMVLLVFRSVELDRLLRQSFPGKSYFNVLNPALEGYWQFFGRVDTDSTFFFHAPVPSSARDGGFDFAALLQAAAGAEFDVALRYTGFWDLRFAIADTYRAGRIFIAGDAAHSHPPYGGYGINTGFEDARNLGWKLAAVLQRWGGAALLDSYSEERRAVFASTARDFIAKSIETDRAFLARFDPTTDAAAFESEWNARATGASGEVNAFEPNYRSSPIVFGAANAQSGAVGTHEYRAQAGRHLAPVPLPSGTNSYDALGTGFTLFAPGPAEPFARSAAELGIPLAVVPEVSPMHESPMILVRPDQFVAWTGAEPEDAHAILRRAAGY